MTLTYVAAQAEPHMPYWKIGTVNPDWSIHQYQSLILVVHVANLYTHIPVYILITKRNTAIKV